MLLSQVCSDRRSKVFLEIASGVSTEKCRSLLEQLSDAKICSVPKAGDFLTTNRQYSRFCRKKTASKGNWEIQFLKESGAPTEPSGASDDVESLESLERAVVEAHSHTKSKMEMLFAFFFKRAVLFFTLTTIFFRLYSTGYLYWEMQMIFCGTRHSTVKSISL